MRVHTVSFKHAFDGIKYVFRTQPNFQFHSLMTTLVLAAAVFFRVKWNEIIILLFAIMLVLIAEMLNTAIEALTDLITVQREPYAKIAKDVAAGMVLMSAILSAIIGLVIFVPYLLEHLKVV